jgi:hypothetical protein
MNLVLVVLWAFAMPYTRFRHMACCLSTVWVCIIIVCKMLYQLSIVDPVEYSNNCTVVSHQSGKTFICGVQMKVYRAMLSVYIDSILTPLLPAFC